MSRECPACRGSAYPELSHPDGWIYRCPECSHAFTDPESRSLETYDEAYFSEAHRNWFQHPNFSLFRKIYKMIQFENGQPSILDIGCGRGDFLFYVDAQRRGLSLTGVDLAPLPDHKQIRFLSCDLFAWQPDNDFSLVTSLAVIEHVQDIRAFVGKLGRLMKRGGRLVIMTLNSDSLVYLVARGLRRLGSMGPFERLYSRHHRHHFTQQSLHNLVVESGLKVTDHFTHNFPLAAVDFPAEVRC